jgi:hypothetical protein
MHWNDIRQFDEHNAEHRQALRDRCLQGGHAAYAFNEKHGWSPSSLSELADVFGVNMTLDNRFPRELLHLDELGGSAYWWKWVEQMAAWWLEGYQQAQAEDQKTEP